MEPEGQVILSDEFKYDVFLSHNSKDDRVVLAIAKQLRADGLRVWFYEWSVKPGSNIPAKIEEGLSTSRILLLFMSRNAFDSDWAVLENQTFRFRDPLNRKLHFIPVRLENVVIKSSLAQFHYIDWLSADREQEYRKLLDACKPPRDAAEVVRELAAVKVHQPDQEMEIGHYAFRPDRKRALSCSEDTTVRLWDVDTGQCLRVFEGHSAAVLSVAWSADHKHALSCSEDTTVRLWDVDTGQCLRVFEGHSAAVLSVAWSADHTRVLSSSFDNTVRLWNVDVGRCVRILKGYPETVRSIVWSTDRRRTLAGLEDDTVRLWDVATGRCLRVLRGHTGAVCCVAWSADQLGVLSGSDDNTIRSWDIAKGECPRVLEGHTAAIRSIAWSDDLRHILSGSDDNTVRLWDLATGKCLVVLKGHLSEIRTVAWSDDQHHAFSGDRKGSIRVWDLSGFVTGRQAPESLIATLSPVTDQVQYTNAKVLVVGDTSSGKTGLAHRLISGKWKPSDGSTVGAWCTQWKLPDMTEAQKLEQEIWLWDFGGQADQRLVHQLYMDHTALILLLFDADKEDVFPGLHDWLATLRRSVPLNTPLFLVAGRIDAGFKASRTQLMSFARENGLGYYETSAREGLGCEELAQAIMQAIPWARMEKRTSPRIFKRIKEEVLKLRDDGHVLLTFKELREILLQRLHMFPAFTDEMLETVIGLLDGPGALQVLEYGTYILLQPQWINVYAQAVIRTLRQHPSDLGYLSVRSIEEGKLIFQTVGHDGTIGEMKRLPQTEERIVLREMELQLEERRLCRRQGDKLIFPSHCGRNRPVILEHPPVFVTYALEGYLDDIYATLVNTLADSRAFKLKELWRDAADFETLAEDHYMGIKLIRESAKSGEMCIYFAPDVTPQEQVIFANYIHAHLEGAGHSEKAQRLRHYVCPHCGTPKGNPEVLREKLIRKGTEAVVTCDKCDKNFKLWDDLEKLFADPDLRATEEGIQAADSIQRATRSPSRSWNRS